MQKLLLKIAAIWGFLYLPFLNTRMLRTAGDDKVYVAQAIEMLSRDTWFFQTLFERPDYYKGPFHYWILILGQKIFGLCMLATVYGNALLLLVAALILGWDSYERSKDSNRALSVSGFFLCSVGLYSHVFASQMEVELAALITIASICLRRVNKSTFYIYSFWAYCGILSWIKSPLHSVLLAVGAFSYLGLVKEKRPFLTRKTWWIGGIFGCFLGVSAYLPILLHDWDAFYSSFLLRENLHKATTFQPWYYPVIPITTYFLFPGWMAIFGAICIGIYRFFKNKIFTEAQALALSLILPSIIFFLFHSYRGQNYHLPWIVGWFYLLDASYESLVSWSENHIKLSKLISGICAFIMILLPALWIWLIFSVPPEMQFWQVSTLSYLAASTAVMVFILVRKFKHGLWLSPIAWVPFFVTIGITVSSLGEFELRDIRNYIDRNKPMQLAYWNSEPNIWNEWGYLNFSLGRSVLSLHSPEKIKSAIERGMTILVAGDAELDALGKTLVKEYPSLKLRTTEWRRWRTKGKSPDGQSLILAALQTGRFDLLWKKFYILDQVAPY